MTKSDFNTLVANRLAYCRQLLTDKDAEYTPEGDKLGNFKRTALMLGTDPLDSWRGMWIKHVDSILELIKQVQKLRNATHYVAQYTVKDQAPQWTTTRLDLMSDIINKLINEKLADNITYSLLCEAILTEVRAEHG